MKQFAFPLLFATVFAPISLFAQASAASGLPINPLRPNTPGLSPLPFGESPLRDTLPLLPQGGPEDPLNTPLAELPEFDLTTRKQDAPVPSGPNRTEEAAIQLAQRIRFRKIKADVLSSPEVKAALDSAKAAKTDRQMRSMLLKHYDLLYSRMKTVDPSLSAMIQEQYAQAVAPLKQTIGPERL